MGRRIIEDGVLGAYRGTSPLGQALLRVLMLGSLTLLAAVAVGRLLAVDPIQRWHEATFEPAVDGLQAVPNLVDVSRTLTDLGHPTVNLAMLAVVALLAVGRMGTRAVPWVLALAIAALLMRPFQSLVSVLVDGTSPESHLVVGTSGPYFSGGVFRVAFIAAVAAVVLGFSQRTAVVVATLAGVLEGITRLVLGRHWPLDIVLAVPIALAAALTLVHAVELLRQLPAVSRSD